MQNTVERLRAEFLEMPGLRLTLTQIHRFCGLERSACSAALDTLVKERFLCANADGTYARLTEGDVSRLRQAKAMLDVPQFRRQAS
jgi:DNA-binding IclR family transcriptional regulator